MSKMIFVNLPVTDVPRATAFYEALGFVRDPMFSAEHASSMQWSEAIVVMLLHRDFFATFTDKRIVDPHAETGALHSLLLESREEVDAFTTTALTNGGRELHEPEDHGFMYSRAFEDPDGNGWGPLTMDLEAARIAMTHAHDEIA